MASAVGGTSSLSSRRGLVSKCTSLRKTQGGSSRATKFPSDRGLTTLVGWSLGRLGPIYFLDKASERWGEINTIYLFDPGPVGQMECEQGMERSPGTLLREWLQSGADRRLVVYAGWATQLDGGEGLRKYYLSAIDGTDAASRVYNCLVDPGIRHGDPFVKQIIGIARDGGTCPDGTRQDDPSTRPPLEVVSGGGTPSNLQPAANPQGANVSPQPAPQAGPQPTPQPAPQPAPRPASQPAPRPASQPAPRPASQPAPRPGPGASPPVPHAANLYDNYGDGAVGHAVCRGNPGNGASTPGGTATETFTAPAGAASISSAMIQIDPDSRVNAHLMIAVNGVLRASADAAAAGDTRFTFGPVVVATNDTISVSVTFSATYGKIITVYTVGSPGGQFTVANRCSDGASNVDTTTTGLRAVFAGSAI